MRERAHGPARGGLDARRPPQAFVAAAVWIAARAAWFRSRSPRGRPSTSPAAASRCPGSGSAEVDQEIKRFQGVSSRAARRRARRRKGGDAVRRGRSTASTGRREGVDDVELTPAAASNGQARRSPGCRSSCCRSPSPARATRRSTPRQGPAQGARRRRGRPTASSRTSSASRRCGRACRSCSKEDLEKAERTGFPLDPDRPAGGLRVGARGAAAGRARLRRGDRHRRGRLLPLAGDRRCRSS